MNYNFIEQQNSRDKYSAKKIFIATPEKISNNKSHRPLLSIIVPVYNEQEVIESCHQRLNSVADTLKLNTEIIYVNDGSSDNSLAWLHKLRQTCQRVAIIDLSRNFGKEVAMTAGFDHARGDAVIVLDADLQDPPELIPQMVTEWQRGYDIVYMKRASRQGESWMKKITAHGFYYIINRISHIDIPEGVGDFRLLSRRAVNNLCRLRESSRFMKGLFAWLGFKQKEILYQRDARARGNSKWNYSALLKLAVDGITSFSTAPLKLASYMAVLCMTLFMLTSLWLGIQFFAFQQSPSTLSLLTTGLLLFAGIQMAVLGIMGEYLGRMYMETKKRPLYLINDWQQANPNNDAVSRDETISQTSRLS